MTTFFKPNEQQRCMAEINNAIKIYFRSKTTPKTAPFSFTSSDLHSHECDVVIQNGGNMYPRSSTEGFKRFIKLIENLSIRYGYSKSTNKNQFVIDKVINLLLKEGRNFYINKGDRYELLNLTNSQVMWLFAETVAQQIRVCKKTNKRNGNSSLQRSREDFSVSVLDPNEKNLEDESIKQDIGGVGGVNETIHNVELPSYSRTPPISFNRSELHSHEHDVVIQNGGKRSRNVISTEGFKAYTDLVEKPSTRAGYDASTNKKQFVIDQVIGPLLKQGRYFYVKKGDLHELIDLTNANTKWEFATKVTQKIRDCNKRLRTSNQREEEENKPIAKKAKYANDVGISDIKASQALLLLKDDNIALS